MTDRGAYRRAGVDIAAGSEAVRLLAAAVTATFGPQVLKGIGAFGGLYDAAALKAMNAPVLVASTDGVGTKTRVAARLGRWDSIGRDLVNHCVNDILAQGARPLFFLDYVASSRLDPAQVAAIVGGMAAACHEAGCALLGGETAEMPGVYAAGEVDLVGTIVGVVERAQIIDGSRIEAGDVILGLPSSGLHTNGYSLARHVLDGLDWEERRSDLGMSIGDALLAVHRSYLTHVQALWAAGINVRGIAHITGGGLLDNPPRMLPPGLNVTLRRDAWPQPPLFGLIQRLGAIHSDEMDHVFNMGLGLLVVVPRDQAAAALAALPGDAYHVGEVLAGGPPVVIQED